MSEEGPSGREGFPQAAMRGRHWGNSAEGLGWRGKEALCVCSGGIMERRARQSNMEKGREKRKCRGGLMQPATRRPWEAPPYPPTPPAMTRRPGGRVGLHFPDNLATCSQLPHLPPTVWTPQT